MLLLIIGTYQVVRGELISTRTVIMLSMNQIDFLR